VIFYQPSVKRLYISGLRAERAEAIFQRHPLITAAFEVSVVHGPWQATLDAHFFGEDAYLALTKELMGVAPARVELETDRGSITMDAWIGGVTLDFDRTVSVRLGNAGPITGALPDAEGPA
jgi:hypothetical protein